MSERRIVEMLRHGASTVMLAVIAGGGFVFSQPAPGLEARFANEAPKKWDEFRAEAKKLQGSYELRWTVVAPDPSKTVRTDVIKQNPDGALLQRGKTTFLEGAERPHDAVEHAFGVNRRYSFSLRRDDPAKGWVMDDFVEGEEKRLRSLGRTPTQEVERAVTFHFYGNFTRPVWEVVRSKAFAVRKIGLADNGKHVRVEYSHQETDGKRTTTYDGWITLDPSRYWHIVEAEAQETRDNSKGKSHSEFAIEVGKRGFPLIKRVTWRYEGQDDKGRRQSRQGITEWTLREDAAVPDREFTLTAFGLPEPGEDQEARTRGPVWYLVVLAGCFSVAATLAYIRRRRTQAAMS